MVIAIKATAAFVILWTLILYTINGFLCIPVNRFWDATVEGACVDMTKFYYGQQIPNIISDFVILVMPMKIIWELPITRVQKALLSGVFLIGGLYVYLIDAANLFFANAACCRTLIFDIFRLIAMIRLMKVGPDVTCENRISQTSCHRADNAIYRQRSACCGMDVPRSRRGHRRRLPP